MRREFWGGFHPLLRSAFFRVFAGAICDDSGCSVLQNFRVIKQERDCRREDRDRAEDQHGP